MSVIAHIISGLSFFMALVFFIRPPVKIGFLVLLPKLLAMALSRFWAILGLLGAILEWQFGSIWATPFGLAAAVFMLWYVKSCALEQKGFEKAFGNNWKSLIKEEQYKLMVKKRSAWINRKPSPPPLWERNVPFWTVEPENDTLLCDIWRPSNGNISGLAFIFLHGSGWSIGDKDFGTRAFFRHLAAQGHTVMDVSYRLLPRVDIYGMVADAKRAIAWIKENAERYGIKRDKVVLCGASAGGHVALLAGYTPNHNKFTPKELKGRDLSVCAMVGFYAPTNLISGYKHYKIGRRPSVPIGTRIDHKNFRKAAIYAGRTDLLLGGYPDEIPEIYRLASPTTHVNRNSPSTLLIQGDKDFIVPLSDLEELYEKLVKEKVPAVKVIVPWSDHGFDILFPRVSPPSQSSLYDIDRFLAIMLNK